MASVQVSRECLASVLGAVHEAEGDPERQEDDERHGQPEGHPGAEGDGLLLGVVGGPHPDQDDVVIVELATLFSQGQSIFS